MTPHIEAKEGEIAKIVLMSGDPLRAKYIAEKYLKDYKLVNKVRGMYAYTGYYKDKRITIMGHGMGMAGSGIYFYELFKFYDGDVIIRIGTCGTANKNINLLDIILEDGAYTESNYAFVFSKSNTHLEYSSKEISNRIAMEAENKNTKITRGIVLTCDVFDPYVDWRAILSRVPQDIEVVATEMESFALFHIANTLNKKAAALLTVVDSKNTTERVSSEDRERSLDTMIELALNSIL